MEEGNHGRKRVLQDKEGEVGKGGYRRESVGGAETEKGKREGDGTGWGGGQGEEEAWPPGGRGERRCGLEDLRKGQDKAEAERCGPKGVEGQVSGRGRAEKLNDLEVRKGQSCRELSQGGRGLVGLSVFIAGLPIFCPSGSLGAVAARHQPDPCSANPPV